MSFDHEGETGNVDYFFRRIVRLGQGLEECSTVPAIESGSSKYGCI